MAEDVHAARAAFSVPPDFVKPDDAAVLDTAAALAATPASATVKGLFFHTAAGALKARGVAYTPPRQYAPFRDYPMREFNEVLFACAAQLGGQGLRAAVTEIGALAFPAFASTLLGRVLYGVYRGRLGAILSLAPRGFELCQSPGTVRVEQIDSCAMIMRFTETYTQVDCYHVGVVRGALVACGVEGDVWVRKQGPGASDLLVAWRERST